jgi:chitin disaccharide deacetylase
MLIINADDWGRSPRETDAALHCFEAGRISSVTAMVFMGDSPRAAELARGSSIEAGLHINCDEPFTGARLNPRLLESHRKTRAYLTSHKLAQLIYNPILKKDFEYSYRSQLEEFECLFGKSPSHIDGHHHMHLCANLALGNVISKGTKLRRTFCFWPGEKSFLNRAYRELLDCWLRRTYRMPDYFFDLSECLRQVKLSRVFALAASANVEVMTHPVNQIEANCLVSSDFRASLQTVSLGSYSLLNGAQHKPQVQQDGVVSQQP